MRAREAAKQDELTARHRLGKFLLRSGHRPPTGVRAWTHLHLIWVLQIRFAQAAQESIRLDDLREVELMRERVLRLEQAIVEGVKLASPTLREVITDLQALRGIARGQSTEWRTKIVTTGVDDTETMERIRGGISKIYKIAP